MKERGYEDDFISFLDSTQGVEWLAQSGPEAALFTKSHDGALWLAFTKMIEHGI